MTMLPLRLLLSVATLFGACTTDREPDPPVEPAPTPARGRVERVEVLDQIDTAFAADYLASVGFELSVEHDVQLLRVTYDTVDPRNELATASMLMAIPLGIDPRAVVSYQHGTQTDRVQVPSDAARDNAYFNDGMVLATVFASHGDLMIAPDYLGLGRSSLRHHPYSHAATEATTTIDAWRAARQVAADRGVRWPDSTFLLGFSQGAHATVAALGALPDELVVRAAAGIAGPYNLSRLEARFIFDGAGASATTYAGYLVSSYARIYGAPPAETYLAPAYAETLAGVYGDGARVFDDIARDLPPDPRELFTTELAASLQGQASSWITAPLAENDVDGVVPAAPLRLYYGTQDVDVVPTESPATGERMRAAGATVEVINVGDVDHFGTAFAAIPQIRAWFDELLN